MAKKFNNGQTFGEIRQILNDNADEINANATAVTNAQTSVNNAQTTADNAQTTADNAQTTANNAQTTATQLADSNTPGRVAGASSPTGGAVPSNILNSGVMTYKNGLGVPIAVLLSPGINITQSAITSSDKAVLWVLNGTYVGAWKTSSINGMAFIIGGKIVAFDFGTNEVWLYSTMSKKWSVVSGGGSSVVTLYPVLNKDLDAALAVKPGETVTYILQKGEYSGAWYDMIMPSGRKFSGSCEGAVTVYPNGFKSAVIDGFGYDYNNDNGNEYFQTFNGMLTYVPSTGWALAINWQQGGISNTPLSSTTGKGDD